MDEINSERWLYVALMSVLTVGYVHMMIFAALLFIFLVYSIGRCMLSDEEAEHRIGYLSPIKLWLFIDDGIFSLMDDLEDDDFDSYGRGEDHSAVERRLALEKLEEKAFETVRQDTI